MSELNAPVDPVLPWWMTHDDPKIRIAVRALVAIARGDWNKADGGQYESADRIAHDAVLEVEALYVKGAA